MRKLIIFCIFIIACLQADFPIPSYELIENAKYYNNKTVTFEGEAIGDFIYTNKNDVWINVNDGHNAFGIWLPLEMAKKIKMRGDYFHKGDIVQINGTFHRACPQHGGDLDIHAKDLEIIKNGYKIKHRFSPEIIPLLILSILLLLITGFIHHWIFSKEG